MLHPIIEAYINTDQTIKDILEKHVNQKQSFERVFLETQSTESAERFENKDLLKKIDQVIVTGHPDENLYLLFISFTIIDCCHYHHLEKAKSLESIGSSILKDNIHLVVQAIYLQALSLIRHADGKLIEFHQLQKKAISIIDKNALRYKSILKGYALMLAVEGRLKEIKDEELKLIETVNESYHSFLVIEIYMINYIMIGEIDASNEILKMYKSLNLRATSNKNLVLMESMGKIFSGNFNESEYSKGPIQYMVKVLNHILNLNFKEADATIEVIKSLIFKNVLTGTLYGYLQIHLELCKGNKGMARLLLKEKAEIGQISYLDDFFYGRLYLLEKNEQKADQAFLRLMENINFYGASKRLQFELQFAKEMKYSDIVLLTNGWKKNIAIKRTDTQNELGKNTKKDKGTDILIGNSPAILKVKELVKKYASLKAPILVTGETGTGKELVSRAIHEEGRNSKEPFLAINCGALSDSLLLSELFGHVAGAFTGAQKERKGIFEEAGRGTVFLDEFGDISPQMQVSLLRVLESNEIRRIGASEIQKIECRIIVATNVNLQDAVSEKRFRQDLFFRITRFEIKLPALRERPEDIPSLMSFFLNHHDEGIEIAPKKLSAELLAELMVYPWPGNIRELKNEMERLAIIFSEKEIIKKDDFDFNHLQNNFQNKKQFPKIEDPQKNTQAPTLSNDMIDKIMRKEKKKNRRKEIIKGLFTKYKKVTRQQIIEIANISKSTASKDLSELLAEGFIVRRAPSKSPSTDYFEIVDDQ